MNGCSELTLITIFLLGMLLGVIFTLAFQALAKRLMGGDDE